MKGKYKIVVKNNRLHYEFEIKRNITERYAFFVNRLYVGALFLQ